MLFTDSANKAVLKNKCKLTYVMLKWRVWSQNELSAIFDIFKVRALSYNTK